MSMASDNDIGPAKRADTNDRERTVPPVFGMP
jgi:hypothetical protein